MNPDFPSLGPTQRRGRTYLLSALTLIAVFFLEGMVGAFTKGSNDIADSLMGIGMAAWILVLAFRGGDISMQLTKGCALLMILPIIILAGFMSWKVARAGIPESATFEYTVSFLVKTVAVFFVLWALFLSTDVREFLIYQRAVSCAKALKKIR